MRGVAAVILRGRAAASGVPHDLDCMTVRIVQAGAEVAEHDGRRLRLDEDACLVLNAGTAWCPSPVDGDTADTLTVAFPPSAVRSALSGLPLLEPLDAAATPDAVFTECLRPRTGATGRAMEHLAARLDGASPSALQPAVAAVLAAAFDEERRMRTWCDRIACVKAGTRRELLRRVLRARDHIESHADSPIGVADVAAAAHLSRFHLVRLFRATLGTTPAALLRDKRLRLARRLLAHPALDLEEVAARVGLGTRSSLFRLLRRELGNGGRALRASAAWPERASLFTEAPACRIHA
ncbi:MAG TPA: AraC family transcriptional regulator [Caldimonas sp.]|nr:AraC family transcriptional regulator [Caldimonas sp.]